MSAKVLDARGNWRSITVSFQVSKEESDAINEAVALSGLTKRAYIINKLLDRQVVVKSSSKTYKALKDRMDYIISELKRIESSGACTMVFLDTIRYVTYIYHGYNDTYDSQESN